MGCFGTVEGGGDESRAFFLWVQGMGCTSTGPWFMTPSAPVLLLMVPVFDASQGAFVHVSPTGPHS